MYEVKPQDYNKKIQEEITKEYRKVEDEVLDDTNKEAAKICKTLEIDERVDVFAEAEPFITYKDHKEDFVQRPKCRLINPAKSSVGKISKRILERVNKKIREITKANQWVCSKEVVSWFHEIQDKKNSTFIKFDIDAFYPSITASLFAKAIEFARQYVEITKTEEEVLWNSRKSFVIKDGKVWLKINNKDFDVTMGAPDGAEVAELVGLFLLSEINKLIPSAGLYRDDGAGVVQMSGPQITKVVKKLHAIFKKYKLKITVEANLKTTDFLDFEMDLNTAKVRPYRKPNNHPNYINVDSSHPKTTIKALPKMIQTRLSSLSSTEKEFDEVKAPYEDALKNAG